MLRLLFCALQVNEPVHGLNGHSLPAVFIGVLFRKTKRYQGLKYLHFFAIILLVVFLLVACRSFQPAGRTNISRSYDPEKSLINPKVAIYHSSMDSTEVFFRQLREELSYEENGVARVKVKWEVLMGYNSREVVDSATIVFNDTLGQATGPFLLFSQKAALPIGESYLLRAGIKDLTTGNASWKYIHLKKEDYHHSQFFKITRSDGQRVFSPLVNQKDSLVIHYRHSEKLYVTRFREQERVPRPPYMNMRIDDPHLKKDSSFTLNLVDGQSLAYDFSHPGIYFLQSDTTVNKGLTLYHFGMDYPQILRHEDMVPPLQYISTRSEYRRLHSAQNPREAVDQFWLDLADNHERARVLIRNYYSRVEMANKLFYTHTPGWKTDRGMAYIVLGTPQVIYRSDHTETWVYGESTRYNAIKLDFQKTDNPYSDNDYRLERTPAHKDEWLHAIDFQRR